jgi:AraC-like DNA-binding protein
MQIVRPAPSLAPYVKHYWLSPRSTARVHTVLPDGCVDVVLEVTGGRCEAWAFGSTTRPVEVACIPGASYFGIRFRPGRSRHFLRAAAVELTGRRASASGLLRFDVSPETFPQLDHLLARALAKAAPVHARVDEAVRLIEAAHGAVRTQDLARQLGLSPRQLQRSFAEAVGVTPKLFAMICRAAHAARLLRTRQAPADAAAQAGYADQSHMTRDFARLAGATPRDVAFLQDPPA